MVQFKTVSLNVPYVSTGRCVDQMTVLLLCNSMAWYGLQSVKARKTNVTQLRKDNTGGHQAQSSLSSWQEEAELHLRKDFRLVHILFVNMPHATGFNTLTEGSQKPGWYTLQALAIKTQIIM